MSAEGMAATVLATELLDAMVKDSGEKLPESFGPAVSEWLRGIAIQLMKSSREESETIVVNREDLRRLLAALTGPPHAIREIVATSRQGELVTDNPLSNLLHQFKESLPGGERHLYREVLIDIAALRNLTATPEQFAKHLQRKAMRAIGLIDGDPLE